MTTCQSISICAENQSQCLLNVKQNLKHSFSKSSAAVWIEYCKRHTFRTAMVCNGPCISCVIICSCTVHTGVSNIFFCWICSIQITHSSQKKIQQMTWSEIVSLQFTNKPWKYECMNSKLKVKFDVVTAVLKKMQVFCNVMLCHWVSSYQRFNRLQCLQTVTNCGITFQRVEVSETLL